MLDEIVHGVVVQMRDGDVPAGESRDARPEVGGVVVPRAGIRRESTGTRDPLSLDLGLGERRPAVDAPVDRFFPLVDEILLDEAAERARDRRLVLEVHREIGLVPRAEDTEALAEHVVIVPMKRSACARHAQQNSAVVMSRFFGPSSRSTFSSMGRPWQS